MAVAAGVLIFGVIGLWWHYTRLDARMTPGAYAPLLAVLGVFIVGRTRGIGMGLVIQGHDKNGGDDAGLAASVRAHLYTLASHGPSGIEVTQQTDVSTLPQEALNLIPAGALAKLAALFVSLFARAAPWHADVTEQSDGSIVVSILRNGVAADSVVIRPSVLWLPDKSASNAGTGSGADDTAPAASVSSGGGSPAGPGTEAGWTAELRTGAAAFILLTLSKRYYHLSAGLSGAQDWRSVTVQVITTDLACHLSTGDKRALLAQAIAEDEGNMAAQLAFLNTSYRTTADQRENRLFAQKLTKLLEIMPTEEGLWPLRLRLRFNLLAAKLNEAASFERTDEWPRPWSKDVPEIPDVLRCAAEQAGRLVAFWQDPESQKAFPDLWQEMDAVVTIAASAVSVEWNRRFRDRMEPSWREDKASGNGRKTKMTLPARYQKVCVLVGRADIPDGQPSCLYNEALDELEMAVALPELRTWARSDPSLAELHDIDLIKKVLRRFEGRAAPAADIVSRFKNLTGDPCPAEFLALSPFAARRADIEGRGIHTAADLGQKSAATLVSELGITVGVADRWLEAARLYTWLRRLPPASHPANDEARQDTITTAMVFLLMEAELDSILALKRELQQDRGDALGQFRARLLDSARPWAVVVPRERDIGRWQRELTCCSGAHGKREFANVRSTAFSDGNSRASVRRSRFRLWF
jgi:hypothetical protein